MEDPKKFTTTQICLPQIPHVKPNVLICHSNKWLNVKYS
jgi:hypothetical protein